MMGRPSDGQLAAIVAFAPILPDATFAAMASRLGLPPEKGAALLRVSELLGLTGAPSSPLADNRYRCRIGEGELVEVKAPSPAEAAERAASRVVQASLKTGQWPSQLRVSVVAPDGAESTHDVRVKIAIETEAAAA